MLVISRKECEQLYCLLDEAALLQLLKQVQETKAPAEICITPTDVRQSRVRLGVDAPQCVRVLRGELHTAAQPTKAVKQS